MPRRKPNPPAGMQETGSIKAVKPKPKKSKDQPNEAIVFIPLTYNDGSMISLEKLNAIQEEIYLSFEGWTHEGTVEGAYRMSSGEKRVEKLMKLSIVLKESDIPRLETLASEWGLELGQEAILIKITDFTVLFVPPREEEE